MIHIIENLANLLKRLWGLLSQLPSLITYDKRRFHNRSLVRIIGTILPLPPAQRVYFNLAAWNPELERFTDRAGCEIVSPKLHEKEGSTYQKQIDHLQEELNAVKEKLAKYLEREVTLCKLEKITITGNTNESKITSDGDVPPPPPPPPPLPPPPPSSIMNPAISKPPRLSKKNIPRYGTQFNSNALHLVLSQLSKEKPKLRHVERSPGGRPIRPKKEPEFDANDILAQVLKKRYAVIQESSDAESFNASFTEISSPIKSALC